MRWWLVVAILFLLVVLMVQDIQARNRTRNQDKATRRRKRNRVSQGRDRAKGWHRRPPRTRLGSGSSGPVDPTEHHGNTLYLEYKNLPEPQSNYTIITGEHSQCVFQGGMVSDQDVWSPKPCVTCLCSEGQVLCQHITCPIMHCSFPISTGECCPICTDPVPNDPSDPVTLLTQEEIQSILWREEEEHHEEEERLRKKDEARRKRRRQRKDQEERQRKIVEKRRREEKEALRLQEEKEEEWRRQMEAEVRKKKKEETERRQKEERRRQEERLMEEEEEVEWLRGDVFQMKEPEKPEELELLAAPIPTPPTAIENVEVVENGVEVEALLPPGCDISDISITCENAKLSHFPPLSIPELKSLSLEGNNISIIPSEAFNGIPNLEWINLKKNQLTSAGIDTQAFKGLKMLRRLYLDGNLLEVVPPHLPPTLQELKINENRLRGVDKDCFQDLSSLVILELEGNLLSEGNVAPEAFNPLVQLSYLRLGRNYFRTIPQGLPSSLLELYLESNLIEEISETVFNQTNNLNVVSLRHNRLDETRIATMAWINQRSLESIDLSHNELYLVPSYLPRSLVHLVLVGNNIERIPGYVFAHMEPGLEYLYLSYNKLDGEGIEPESFFGSYHSMVELCLDHNQLIAVPSGINEMTNLHFLRLNNNMIRSIPDEGICDPSLSGDSTLVALRLDYNYINPQKVPPTAFSCIHSSSSIILKPQKT
ncbi:extracellular matrix protein 2 isoform X2 [Sphaeramia orbicularis]|uniref:extracellular matrix protein 2 isoform X2 n=1 Tax=Sphaeramia orbicularis TaxID=375764 RepID=UPI00117F1214|nr:extracellular matrix protein 2 isoform X2 [Sphaeramia orbicularis]